MTGVVLLLFLHGIFTQINDWTHVLAYTHDWGLNPLYCNNFEFKVGFGTQLNLHWWCRSKDIILDLLLEMKTSYLFLLEMLIHVGIKEPDSLLTSKLIYVNYLFILLYPRPPSFHCSLGCLKFDVAFFTTMHQGRKWLCTQNQNGNETF